MCLFSPGSSPKLLLWWGDWTATFTPPSSFQAIFQLCFSIYFWSFFILSLWVFFLIVSSASFAFLPTPMCGIYYLGAVRIFLSFNSAIFFIDLFHNTSVPFVFFFIRVSLSVETPHSQSATLRLKTTATVLSSITYSYSHGWVSYMLTFIAVLNSGVQKGKNCGKFCGEIVNGFHEVKES